MKEQKEHAEGKHAGGRPPVAFSQLEIQAAAELRSRGISWETVAALIGRTQWKITRELDAGRIVPEPTQDAPLLARSDYRRMPGRRPWTDAEDLLLADAYGPDAPHPESTRNLAHRLHRPMASIARRAAIIGLAPEPKPKEKAKEKEKEKAPRPWTQDEDARLAELWPDNSVLAVARALGREPEDVRRRAGRIVRGETRPVRADGDWWTSGEDEAIRELYPVTGAAVLALRMGRSVEAVERRAGVVLQGVEDSKSLSAYRIVQGDEKLEEKIILSQVLAETEEPRAI